MGLGVVGVDGLVGRVSLKEVGMFSVGSVTGRFSVKVVVGIVSNDGMGVR